MRRDTLVYGTIFLLLIGFIVFYQMPRAEKGYDESREAERKLFSYDEDGVFELSIVTGKAKTVCLRDNVWKIVFPKEAPADVTEIKNVMSILSTAEVRKVVDEEADNIVKYGLDKPVIRISLKIKDGEGKEKKLGLILGRKNPDGTGVYSMRSGEPSVFLLPSYVIGTLDKDPWALRNKYIFSFLDEEPSVLEWYSENGGEISVENKDGVWRLTKPELAEVDQNKMRVVISAIRYLSVNEFLDYGDGSVLEECGLLNTKKKLVVKGEDERAELLLVGAKMPESDAFYAMRDGKKELFTISGDNITKTFPLPDTIRK